MDQKQDTPKISIIPKTKIDEALASTINKIKEDLVSGSFSHRHPELGRMIKCQVCGFRHRSYIVCKQNIIASVPQTVKGVNGAAMFAKKRFNPHHSKKLLQLVELTKTLFSKYHDWIEDIPNAMLAARGEAYKILTRQRRARRRIIKGIQKESRRQNRG